MSAIRRLCVLGVLVVPATAHAGNGLHPRTPVDWGDEKTCMTIVDRTDSAVLELKYTIPYEDLRPMDAKDEVDDSREHQFLAFCRAHSVQDPLPVWLSTADLAAAQAKGLINDVLPEDVIDTNDDWKDCMVRITADDDRRLITFAEAAAPVVWDTTGLAVGGYVVSGYTWEPPFNIYSLRNGVIKVIDDPDPVASPPAMAISNGLGEEIVYQTESLKLYGCISAMDGSTITGSWAHTDNEGGPLVWNVFEADAPVVGDTFEMMFAPPAETATKLVALKIEITDPMDRTYTAHMDVLASVLEGGPPSTGGDCSDSAGFIAEPGCGDSETEGSSGDFVETFGATGELPGTSGGGTATAPTEGGGGSGGASDGGTTDPGVTPPAKTGCAIGGAGGGTFAWLGVMWLVWRRRRA